MRPQLRAPGCSPSPRWHECGRDDEADFRGRAGAGEWRGGDSRAAIRPGRRSSAPSLLPAHWLPSSNRQCQSTPPAPAGRRNRSTGAGASCATIWTGGEAERRRPAFFGERVLGLLRVGGQAERGDQPRQRLFAGLVHHPERIDMAGRDADQIGDTAQFVEPAHRGSPSGGHRIRFPRPLPICAGAGATGARLMNSAKECARNR